MAPPNPRSPYGGPEETSEVRRRRLVTHPAIPIDQRVMVAEERAAGAEEVAIALGRELRAEIAALGRSNDAVLRALEEQAKVSARLVRALDGPEGQQEQGLTWKVSQLHTRSRKSDGVIQGVATTVFVAFAIGVGAWLLQLWAKTHGG